MTGPIAPQAPDGRRLRWQKHNAARRQFILDAALQTLEQHPAGAEIHVQQIAEQAAMSRTVIYRHFQDRADLDLAIQQEICDRLSGSLMTALRFEGTVRQITHRLVEAFVAWAVQHPSWLRFVERDLSGPAGRPIDEAIAALTQRVEGFVNQVIEVIGLELTAADRAIIEPWIFGIVGGCFNSVRRWASRPILEPGPEAFVTFAADTIWFQFLGVARQRGADIPELPVEALVAALSEGATVGADDRR